MAIIDNEFIFGANDEKQIAEDRETLSKYLVKSNLEKLAQSTKYSKVVEVLVEANIIVVIGANLGTTDNRWREQLIGSLAINKNAIIIFNKYISGSLPKHSPVKMARIIDEEITKFRLRIQENKKLREFIKDQDVHIDQIEKRTFVAPFSDETSNIGNLKFFKV